MEEAREPLIRLCYLPPAHCDNVPGHTGTLVSGFVGVPWQPENADNASICGWTHGGSESKTPRVESLQCNMQPSIPRAGFASLLQTKKLEICHDVTKPQDRDSK